MEDYRIQDVVAAMRRLAPEEWAEDWDNVGWLVRRETNAPLKVVLSLDPVDPESARANGYTLNVSHHPTPFRPLKRVDDGTWAVRAWAAGLNLYAAHTNLDVAPNGVNDALAGVLGLKETQPLVPSEKAEVVKFVTFVPPDHVDAVRKACAEAGAGVIGKYTECAFLTPGTGTFRPMPGADPYTETPAGELEREAEVRLDMLVPRHLMDAVVEAARAAHPYEEMAYDVMLMANRQGRVGLGRIGKLEQPLALADFASVVADRLGANRLSVAGPRDRTVETVAVMGGSGGGYWSAARSAGADLYITGEVSHHHALDAGSAGLTVLDAGHFPTERPVLKPLQVYLREALPGLHADIADEADPLQTARS